jgi:hypothetical protein
MMLEGVVGPVGISLGIASSTDGAISQWAGH